MRFRGGIVTDCQRVTPPYIPSPKGRGFTAVLIKKLVELDVLVPAGRSGNKKSFIMNPQIAVKGEHDQQKLDNYLAAKAANEASKDNEPQADE